MKRYTLVGATVSLALFSSAALAAPNIVNTTQKGSLLVFPEIVTDDDDNYRNTIIRITNDNTGSITVKCYYGEFTDYFDDPPYYGPDKPTRDFQFTLTKNQPAYWEVKDGTGTIAAPNFPTQADKYSGQLICWAVSKGGGTQVKWNHLSGTATVTDTNDDWSYSYNAYQFYARGAKNKKQVGSTAGVLELDGTAAGGGYDKCGRYLIGHFAPRRANIYMPGSDVEVDENYVSISSCTQDLSPVGKANELGSDSSQPFTCGGDDEPSCGQTIVFDVWNEDEVKFTGAREKADSWWRVELDDNAGGGTYSDFDVAGENFDYDTLQTASAYFRAESDNGYGLLGVLVTDMDHGSNVENHAVTLNHAGARSGMIIWRPQDDDPPEKM